MPPREGQRVIDKLRKLAAVAGYWPLVIAVFLLVSSPYRKLEAAQNERMRIWSQLVQMSIEQETAYQPVMDMIRQRGDDFAAYRVITGALPWMLLVSAVVFRNRIRRSLHLDQPVESQSLNQQAQG